MNEIYIIEISNGRKKIYSYRHLFREHGFHFEKRSYGKSFYTKSCNTIEEREFYKKLCKKNRLNYCEHKKEYARSNDYRKIYLNNLNARHKYELCAYCGIPIKREKFTVDHIIPIDKAKKTNRAKILMKLLKIKDVNDSSNLCIACKQCNNQKRTKMGVWIIRGFIGKNRYIWYLRWILRLLILLLALVYLFHNIF